MADWLTVYICVRYLPTYQEPVNVVTLRVMATGRVTWWPWWVD